jgi:hypothetical protein
MNTYLFLLHETPVDAADLSADAMAALVAEYRAWAAGLAERGLLVGGEKLADDGGRWLQRQGAQLLATDGPYAEAHDVIGGFFSVRAESLEAAQVFAVSCPHLRGRNRIEIRLVEAV